MLGPIRILSVQFPSVCVRLDGKGVTKPTGPGGGVVNAQYVNQPGPAGFPYEQFKVQPQSGGTVSFESVPFPGVFIRMDGTGVNSPTAPGGGVVNAQFTAGPWEKFFIRYQTNCQAAIESAAFPGVFLRLDGTGVTQPTAPGGGKVNCQFGVGPWEKFYLIAVV